MLTESLITLLSLFTGKYVSKKTAKEVEQWIHWIRLVPLFCAVCVTVVILAVSNMVHGLFITLIGACLSALFWKPERVTSSLLFAGLAFFLAVQINHATALRAACFFIAYFFVKGSLYNDKPLKAVITVVLAITCFYALNFVRVLSLEVILVFSLLFCGAVVGGELVYVVKSNGEA
jgi:hypothetical protein